MKCFGQFLSYFANLQASRGAERRSTAWQEEPGGGWRSAGVYGKIFGCSFYFHTRSLFSFTWELGSGWACLDQFLADRVEREETNWMKVKVFSFKLFCRSLLLSVLETVLLTKILANKTEKIFPASDAVKTYWNHYEKNCK